MLIDGTREEVERVLGLGPKEMASLLSISVKTYHRGVRNESPAGVLLEEVSRKLGDPRSAQSVRALAIISARGGGFPMLLERLFSAFVTLDLLRP